MKVKLKKDDPEFNLKKGEVFKAEIYVIDPSKITIFRRDKAICNQYRKDVKIIK